ncbi:MAG: hypothetical protein ACE5H8_02240 [Alphaproteobacteria bacterium]
MSPSHNGIDLATVEATLREVGFTPRGAFHPAPEDGAPPLDDGRPTATLVLAGNVGPAMWQAFALRRRDAPDPLDRWTRRTLEPLAGRLDARALFPFGGPPHLPFQRWARRAEPVWPSPIGPLIHADYGLWHAYRGALAFAQRLDLPPSGTRANPCDACAEKPCLDACPVGAFKSGVYDISACAGHIATTAGADCMALSCRARRACPVGRGYAYEPEQARFHMAAFLKARRGTA